MGKEIKTLQPEAVWNHFYELTQIPRPTFHTEAVVKFIYEYGKSLGLETERDEVGNVIIRKPASEGMENRPVVTLQSHLDMVPQKNSDKEHDFEKDPIDAYIDGDWVKAKGTTLGADNGIGAAMALAVLADKTLKHGPIEALFTIDEETGMVGANNLKAGFSKGDILINLDSESEGELFIGCAGGMDVNVSMEYKDEQAVPEGDIAVKISLTGLKGGHSGMDIDLGRGNANKLMVRFLKEAIQFCGAHIAWIDGGSLRNAIPREAFAVITIPKDDTEGLWELVSDYQDTFNGEFAGVEENISLKAEKVDLPKTIIPEEIQDAIINASNACVNGPISMLKDFHGIVESSTNLARLLAKDGEIVVGFLVRSSCESRKLWIASAIESAFVMAGMKVEFDGSYNGWNPNINSHVYEVMNKTYKDLFGNEPKVTVIHAGLECGIIQGVMPEMDMISVGPDIRSPHSPDERVNVPSVAKTWKFLIAALERI